MHVAAPGENIYSTLPNGRYGYLTGTSQATAFVSGEAALILSENPKLRPSEVRQIMMSSVDKIKALESKIASGGRINAYASLKQTIAMRDGDKTQKVAANGNSKDSIEVQETIKRLKRDVAFH